MLIKKLSDIQKEVIFEQEYFTAKSFLFFLSDFKRSGKYAGSILAFLFFGFAVTASSFTLPNSQFEWSSVFYFNIALLLLFILAQYIEWIKCYLIENDDIWFGFVSWGKCIFITKKNRLDLVGFRVLKDFSHYVFIFNGGFIKYTLSYSKDNPRIKDVEHILEKNSELLKEFRISNKY